MITVKEAVAKAVEAIKEFYAGENIYDILLEEVEKDSSESAWLITLSFQAAVKDGPVRGKLAELTSPDILGLKSKQYLRKYKIFTVDAATGNVKSMKIRELQNA